MFRALAPALVIGVMSGCRPQPQPTVVYDVGAWSLVRDYPTAQSYSGHMVRVRLRKGTYTVVGRELHVVGDIRNTPPLIVFQCRESPPAEPQTLIVTGRCLPPVRDRVWRTVLADFCLTVTDCSVTQSPDP